MLKNKRKSTGRAAKQGNSSHCSVQFAVSAAAGVALSVSMPGWQRVLGLVIGTVQDYVPHQEEKSVSKVLKDDFYLPIRTYRLKWESAISPALYQTILCFLGDADILPYEPVD